MGTVSSIAASSLYQTYRVAGASSTAQALVATGTALQAASVSDTISVATSDQASAEESQSVTKPAPPNAQADADYANLVSDVQSGDLGDAQEALAKLQIDLMASHGGHHHLAESASPAPTAVTTDALGSTSDTSGSTSDTFESTSDSSTSGNYFSFTV